VFIVALKVWIAIMIGPLIIAVASAIEILKVLWNAVLVPLASFIATVLTPVIRTVASVLQTVFKVAVVAVTTAATFLWQNVLVPIGRFLQSTFKAAVGVGTAAWNAFKAAVDVVKSAVLAVKDKAIQPVINFIKATASPIISTFEAAWDGVTSAVRTARNVIKSIIDVIKSAIDKAGDLISKLKNIPGVGVVGDVLGSLQHGGIIDKDQLAALHAPEVVIPLNEPARAAALAQESGLLDQLIGQAAPSTDNIGHATLGGSTFSGSGVVIQELNVNVNGPISQEEATATADRLSDAIQVALARKKIQFAVGTT